MWIKLHGALPAKDRSGIQQHPSKWNCLKTKSHFLHHSRAKLPLPQVAPHGHLYRFNESLERRRARCLLLLDRTFMSLKLDFSWIITKWNPKQNNQFLHIESCIISRFGWVLGFSEEKGNDESHCGGHWMTYFKLGQIHHVMVTDGTASLIVPRIGDVVGQEIQVYLK